MEMPVSTNRGMVSWAMLLVSVVSILLMACATEATTTSTSTGPGSTVALASTPTPAVVASGGETPTVAPTTMTTATPAPPEPVAVGENDTLVGPEWWPSRWGADDEAGASNWITPDKVMEAVQLISAGEIYELGRIYEAGMPLFGQRAFSLRVPSAPTGGPFGENRLVYNDEYLATEIGQVGTQFDGLGHIGVQVGAPKDLNQMRYYNGITGADIASPYGLNKLGIERVKPLLTPGILIDVAGFKGRMLEAGEEITLADVQGALRRQGMSEEDIRPGDAVLFNTGWGSLWMVDNERYNNGAPGIGLEAARWLIGKEIALVGADTWPVEVVPNPDPTLAFPVHGELIVRNGIFIHENLDFTGLIEDEVYRFAYIFVRVPIKGATGSPGSPIAVR